MPDNYPVIDPINPEKDELPILAELLKNFKNNLELEILSKETVHEVQYKQKKYLFKLKHSIGKPYEQSANSDEFYAFGGDILGRSKTAVVKKAHRLKLFVTKDSQSVFVSSGLMAYKRMGLKLEYPDYYQGMVSEVQQEANILNKKYDLKLHVIEKKDRLRTYLFVPFVPGKGLFGRLESAWRTNNDDNTIEKKLSFLRQQYRELNEMHTRKEIVHLDIKPENIIITPYDQLRHIDYGFSHNLSKKLPSACGTLGYTDPNLRTHVNQAKEYNIQYLPKADIYSSGLTSLQIISDAGYFDLPINEGINEGRLMKEKFPSLLKKTKGWLVHVMTISDKKPIDLSFLDRAKEKKIPVFIKKIGSPGDKPTFFIYGDQTGYGNWEYTEITSDSENIKNIDPSYEDNQDLDSRLLDCSDTDTFQFSLRILTEKGHVRLKKSNNLISIFNAFIDNVTNDDSMSRLSAKSAEIVMGLLASGIFRDYLNSDSNLAPFNFEKKLPERIKDYSLKDLFYFIKYFDNKEENVFVDDILFLKNNSSAASFKEAIIKNKGAIIETYQIIIKEQLSSLKHIFINSLYMLNRKDVTSNTELKALFDFIGETEDFADDEKLEKLVSLIEKVILFIIDTQAGHFEKDSIPVIQIFNLNPFILEQISPAILDRIYQVKIAFNQYQEELSLQSQLKEFANTLIRITPNRYKNNNDDLNNELANTENTSEKLVSLIEKTILSFIDARICNPIKDLPSIKKLLLSNQFILEKIFPNILEKIEKAEKDFHEKMLSLANKLSIPIANEKAKLAA